MIELRDYQQDLFDKAMASSRQRLLVVAPCGAGKTVLAFALMQHALNESPEAECLMLVHRVELLRQHRRDLMKFGLDSNRVRIESVFTEAKRLGQHKTPSLLILDEAHLSRSKSWEMVAKYYNTKTIGLTATPCRLDGKPLGDIFQELIQGISHKQLEQEHRLAPYEYYAPTELDMSNVSSRGGDYATEEVEPLLERAVYGNVIETYRRFADGKKAIAFCTSVSHSEKVSAMFNSAGITAAHLDAKMSAKKRRGIIDDFRSGRVQVISSCNIISEGLSIDDCECCLLLRPTQSTALYIQQACRCLRYQEGKKAVIIDYVGNYLRHGMPDDDREWSLTGTLNHRSSYNQDGTLKLRVCKNCFKTFETSPVCPFCGYKYELTEREIKQIENIELQKITAEKMAEDRERRLREREELKQARTKGDLVRIAKERGYKPGWVYEQMRLRKIKH